MKKEKMFFNYFDKDEIVSLEYKEIFSYPQWPNVQFVLHKSPDGKQWTISEWTTGRNIIKRNKKKDIKELAMFHIEAELRACDMTLEEVITSWLFPLNT